MTRKRKSFSKEFKQAAVKRLEDSGDTLAEVAASLGVSISNLSQWRSQYRAASPEVGRQTTPEIRALMEELQRVKEERDVLRKAISYLAKGL
jgi:transposase